MKLEEFRRMLSEGVDPEVIDDEPKLRAEWRNEEFPGSPNVFEDMSEAIVRSKAVAERTGRPVFTAGEPRGGAIITDADAKAEYGDGRVPAYTLTARISNGREIVFEIPSSVDPVILRDKIEIIKGTEFFGDDQLAALLGLRILRASGPSSLDDLAFRREYLGSFPPIRVPAGIDVPALSPEERVRFDRVGLPYRGVDRGYKPSTLFVKLDPGSTVFGPPTTPDDLPEPRGDLADSGALAKIKELMSKAKG
jgi:hypothetical protein